jgi:hypothetical protein
VPIDLELDQDLFGALGTAVAVPHGPISPWRDTTETVTDDRRRRLAALGAVDDAGGVSPALAATLTSLADNRGATAVRFASGPSALEYVNFLAPDSRLIGLRTVAATHLQLSDPAPTEQVVSDLAGLIGRSPLRGMVFKAELSLDDAFVFGALVDRLRRQLLRDLADDASTDARPVSVTAIRGELEQSGGLFGFTSAIAKASAATGERAVRGAAKSITRLAAAGLVSSAKSGAKLEEECSALPQRFLVISALTYLQNVRPAGAGIERTGFSCIQSGVHDLLVIEHLESGVVHLETLDSETIVTAIGRSLRRPDAG